MTRPADNPFASRRIDTLTYRFRGGVIDDLIATLTANGGRGAIVGPHGSGKTTLLDSLANRLEGDIVRIHLGSDTRAPFDSALRSLPPTVHAGHTVLLDGAEQLGRLAWWRFHRRVRRAGAVVITTHAPGRLPTGHECHTDPGLLIELVEELAPEGVEVDLEEIFHGHGGNLRECFRELYDVWAKR